MSILTGRVLIYRVFDIGADANLEAIQKNILLANSPQRFKLSKTSRAMIINNAPLSLSLEGGQYSFASQLMDYEVSAKIWHFGAISLSLQVNLPDNLKWNQLVEISAQIENDENLHEICVQKAKQLIQQFDSNRLATTSFETYEDYSIFFLKSLAGVEQNASSIFAQYDVNQLILAENSENLSEQIKKSISEGYLQYNQNDLAVINWNSALILEPSGSMDIPDVIEFALCQLLEMRYYDDVLDERLAFLYSELEKSTLTVWESSSEKLSKEAARKYLEISDTIESVENSLKVVGDFYLAQVFRAASARFRFNDWQHSVNQKLENLAQISKLLTSELNEKRNRLLEIIIIVLISIELIPFFLKLF